MGCKKSPKDWRVPMLMKTMAAPQAMTRKVLVLSF
jgi:hypothetical protein